MRTAAIGVIVAATLSIARPMAGDVDGSAILSASARTLGTAAALKARWWFVEAAGRENLSAELQGISADTPTWRPHHEWVGADVTTDTVGWDRRTPRNDLSVRHRRFVYAAASTTIVDHTNDRAWRNAGEVSLARRRALMRRIPHLLIKEAAALQATAVRAHSEVRFDGRTAERVVVDFPDDGAVAIVVGRSPTVPLAASYELYFPGRGNVTVEWRWSGWKPDAALGYVPTRHRIVIDGQLFQDVEYARYAIDAAETERFLDPPLHEPHEMPAVPPWAAGTAPEAGEVAPGVHVIRVGGFTSLSAETGDGVVVFEAPEPFFGTESIPASNRSAGGTLTPQLLEEVRKRHPGRTIQRVVVSHHHGDHLGGLGTFSAAGVAALVPSQDVAAARRATQSVPGLLQQPRASARAVVNGVRDVARIGGSRRGIQAINVGANPHSAGNLVLWLPADGIMIQGDLFYFDRGSGFQAGRDRMNAFFAQWLRERGLRPKMLFGVHNRGAAGPEAIDAVGRP